MADISNLTRQHKEIMELLDKLGTFNTEGIIEKEAFTISMLLGQLSGKINIHLSSEDKFLYPRLKESGDGKTRQLSNAFSANMGGLATAFTEFKVKYMSSARITANPPGFQTELKQVTKAIKERIAREEADLYPLLDRL